ncbi:hypothetical protein [Desmospora profundinema]|uniref:Uncharacterized protein n=1 Tax=Desmospora profundinema TaxID=1571184 RepID=A0ABU1IR44_9BACL|nr:hypothetical protein [Desmospora profundinema]MDR6226893.1 hypothetical protein [Desmospora profundinema]
MEQWTFMGRSVLPYEVDRTVRNDFPSTGWSPSWPRREQVDGDWYYCLPRTEEPWWVVIRQDGKALSEQEAKRIWRGRTGRGCLSNVFRGLIGLLFGLAGFVVYILFALVVGGQLGVEGDIVTEPHGITLFLAIFYFFLFALWGASFAFPKSWCWLEVARKRRLLGGMLAAILVSLPIGTVFASTYEVYMEDGILYSDVGEWGKQKKVAWADLEEVNLQVENWEYGPDLVVESVTREGRTFKWSGSFREDGETFLSINQAAFAQGANMTVEWLNGEQLFYINEAFGDDVRQFFYEVAQDFEKRYPDDPRAVKNRNRE